MEVDDPLDRINRALQGGQDGADDSLVPTESDTTTRDPLERIQRALPDGEPVRVPDLDDDPRTGPGVLNGEPVPFPEDGEGPSIDDRLQNAAREFARGTTTIGSQTLKGIGTTARALNDLLGLREGEPVDEYSTYQLGQAIESWAQEAFPRDEEMRGRFETKLANALGQGAGFMAGGAASSLARGGAYAFPAVTGSLMGGARQFEEAKAAGASDDEATTAMLTGMGFGATEAVPIARLLNRLDRGTGGVIKRSLFEAAREGSEEAAQELVQTVGDNLAALSAYDEDRELTRGIREAAEVGGSAGAILGGITQLLAGRAMRRARPGDVRTDDPEPTTEEAEDTKGTPTEEPTTEPPERLPTPRREEAPAEAQSETAAGTAPEATPPVDPTARIEDALAALEAGEVAIEEAPSTTEEESSVRARTTDAPAQEPIAAERQQPGAVEPAESTVAQDELFELLQRASLEELSAVQQRTESPVVLEEVQQSRVIQHGEDPATAVELPDVDPKAVDVRPEIEEAVRQVEELELPRPTLEEETGEARTGVRARTTAAAEEDAVGGEQEAFRQEVAQAAPEELQATAADPDLGFEEARIIREEIEARRDEGGLTSEEADPILSALPERVGQGEEATAQEDAEQEEGRAPEATVVQEESLEEARQVVEEERGKVVSGQRAVENLPETDSGEDLEGALRRRLETLQSQLDEGAEPSPAVITEAAILRNAVEFQQEAPQAARESEEVETAADVDIPAAPQVQRERQAAREAITGLPRDEKQILEEIARTSEDPAEIALAFRQAQEVEETRRAANDLERQVRARSPYSTEQYEGVVGSNIQRDEDAVRLRMLSEEGTDLDEAAMQISEELGREVSVQELADTIRRVGLGQPGTRTVADRLAGRFEEVTGRGLTERRADRAIQQAIEEETRAPASQATAEEVATTPDRAVEPVTAPFQRTRRLSRVAQLRRQRGERLFRGEEADGQRVQPRPERLSEDVGTFREMLEELQEEADVEIQRSQLPRAAAGMYEAGTGTTIVRTPNDVDTAIHEVAHAIDDRYGVLEEWAGEETSPLDEELIPQFSRHGSGQTADPSTPETPDAERGTQTYERAEGFAEWLRAYAVNPQEARERAPETFERYQEAVPEEVRDAIDRFGRRLRNYAAAVEAGDPQATLANVETDLDPPGVLESLKERFDFLFEDRGLGDTWMDRLAVEVWDELRIVMKVWDSANAMQGRDLDELDIDDNFRVLARLFNGLGTRVMRYLESGLEDMQGNTVTEGGFDRILEPLDTSSKQKLQQELGDGVALLVNERIVERASAIREDAEAVRQNYEMVRELKDDLRSVENRLDTARRRRDKARRQEEYRSEQFQGEEVVESHKKRRDALTAVTRNLRRETKRAEQHLRTARRKRENARSAVRRAEQRWDNHREQMETVTDWANNEAKTRELRDEVERQQERFDKWQEKVMELEETRDELRAQLETAESELESARDHLEQERRHRKRAESAAERIERYEDEVERLEETRDALREDIQGAEGRMNEAKRRLNYDGRPSDVEEWAEGRVERLAGTGGGIFSDEDVAMTYLERLQEDPERMDRLQAFARRYREWADALLQRLRDAGILSDEQVEGIRERNQYYAAFNRVEGQEEAFVMDDVNSETARSIGGLASDQQVVYRFKGSTRTMQNPLVSLLAQTHAVVTETERNQMLQAFVNSFRSDRTMYEGDVLDLGRIARKATSEDVRTIEVKVEGETEYWQLHPEIYKTMKNIDGVEQRSGFVRLIKQAIRFSRNLITYSPAFVTRQLFRDPQEIALKTESGFRPWENLTYFTDEESREQFVEDVAALESAGGAQFGWHVRGREGYYEQMRRTIEDLSDDSGTVITSVQNIFDTYKRLVEKSEIASRAGDFRRRYEEFLDQGMDEYDARRKAAYETRNLMDFAQGGRAIKQLNDWIVFLNPAVQGLRTAMRAGRENPSGLAWRFLMYGLTAEVGAYVWNALMGDDALERWRQEPAYLKDFFYTFHIPGADWLTLRIPKTYEFGLISSLFIRSAEKGLALATGGEAGDPNAFGGIEASARTAFMPLDPGAVASSPGLSLLNVQANWDPFRQRHIVNPYEAKLDLDLREGGRFASRLGQGLQWVGMHTLGRRFAMDARKWDYLIQSLGGGSGRLLTTASDIGRTNQAGRNFWMDASGLFVHPPVYGSRDVQFVLDWAERRGRMNLASIERVETLVDAVYEAEDPETRRARAVQLWEYARKVRADIEGR